MSDQRPYLTGSDAENKILSDLITANHILDHYKLIDAFGHISTRPPTNPSIFLMSGNSAPAFISRTTDLFAYNLDEAVTPCIPRSGTMSPYSERFIHAEIYRMYADVRCVVHSHSNEIVAWGVSGRVMRPVMHMAGFLGSEVPVWEPEEYEDGVGRDLLVKNARLGQGLARAFTDGTAGEGRGAGLPDRTVVLQRGHGFTTWGSDLKQAVYRAVYTQENATNLRHALEIGNGEDDRIGYLSEEEIRGAGVMNKEAWRKGWAYWSGLVASNPMYRNELATDDLESKKKWKTV